MSGDQTTRGLGYPAREDPNRSKSKALVWSSLTALVARGIGVVGPLVVTPILLTYLGPETYGLWVTVASLLAMAVFADLGLGSGMMTQLAASLQRGDTRASKETISSGYAVVTLLALFLLLLALGGSAYLRGNLSDDHVFMTILSISVIGFIVNLPLSVIHRVQYAQQQAGVSNIWQAGGGLAQVLAILLAIRLNLGVAGVALFGALSVPLVNMVNSVWHFTFAAPALRPRASFVVLRVGARLLRLGVGYAASAIMLAVTMNINPILIAATLGAAVTAEYSLATRVLAPLTMLSFALFAPLWPALSAAISDGEFQWVRRTILLSAVALGSLTALLGGAIALFSPWIFHAWLGEAAQSAPPISTVGSVVPWLLALSIVGPIIALESSRERLLGQNAALAAFLSLSIPAKLLIIPQVGVVVIGPIDGLLYAILMGGLAATALRSLKNHARMQGEN